MMNLTYCGVIITASRWGFYMDIYIIICFQTHALIHTQKSTFAMSILLHLLPQATCRSSGGSKSQFQ